MNDPNDLVQLNCTYGAPYEGRVADLAEFENCTDGTVVWIIDRTDVEGIPAGQQVEVWGRTGRQWNEGPLPQEDKAACQRG